jgi:hypothetical protein
VGPGAFGSGRAPFEAELRALLREPVYAERRRDVTLEVSR